MRYRVYGISPHQDGTGVIYCIHQYSTGMKYVGQTRHKFAVRIETHYIKQHLTWFVKTNKNDYCVAEIERVPVDELLEREDYWIHQLNTINNGYNTKYRGCSNGRVMTGKNNYNSSTWLVTFDDGHTETHQSLVEMVQRGYSKSKLSILSTKGGIHKDVVAVTKIDPDQEV